MINEADLAKLSFERVGGRVSRLMNSSSKVNRFLNRDNKIPTAIKDLSKWVDAQAYGIANAKDIVQLVDAACKRTIKSEVDKVTEEFAAMQLTDEQTAKLPDAITAYEAFLQDYVSKLKRVKDVVTKNKTTSTVAKPKAKAAAKPKAKEEVAA